MFECQEDRRQQGENGDGEVVLPGKGGEKKHGQDAQVPGNGLGLKCFGVEVFHEKGSGDTDGGKREEVDSSGKGGLDLI